MFATLLCKSSSVVRLQNAFETCFKKSLQHHQQSSRTMIPLFQQEQKSMIILFEDEHKQINERSAFLSSLNELVAMNRNGRRPKKANHGRRPVCRVGRRAKTRKWGNPSR